MGVKKSDFEKKLEALHQKYAESLVARIAELEQACEIAIRGESVDSQLQTIRFEAHKLKGSSASFGYPRVEERAKRLEFFLHKIQETGISFDQPQGEQLRLLIAELKRAALGEDSPVEQESGGLSKQSPSGGKDLYLISQNPVMDGEITRQLSLFGYAVHCYPTVAQAFSHHQGRPQAILIQVPDQNPIPDLAICHKQGIPVVLLDERSDFDSRLKGFRSGGAFYVAEPFDVVSLIHVLREIDGTHINRPYRVLILDGDPIQAELHSFTLEEAGMVTRILTNPLQILATLESFQPELLLLALRLPHCTGAEVAGLIRQIPQFAFLPIVYLSAEEDMEEQIQAMRSGAEQFATKPIDPGGLVTLVRRRIQHNRRFLDLQVEAAALRRELAARSRLLDQHEPVWYTDLKGRIIYVNGAFQDWTGRNLAHWFGTPLGKDSEMVKRLTISRKDSVNIGWLKGEDAIGHPIQARYTLSIVRDAAGSDLYAIWAASPTHAAPVHTHPMVLPEPLGPAPEEEGDESLPNKAVRILVVEDNPISQKIAARLLEHAGYSHDLAHNGQEAVDMHTKAPYDLILMDCRMPEMDGFQATAAIRAIKGNAAHVPILAMTAGESNATKEQCLLSGMNDILIKPVKPGVFREALSSYLAIRGRESSLLQVKPGPPVDMTRFRRLAGEEPSLQRDYVHAVTAAVDARLRVLRTAVLEGNALDILQESEALAALCGELGAPVLTALAKNLKSLAAGGRLDAAGGLVASFMAELERVQIFLGQAQSEMTSRT